MDAREEIKLDIERARHAGLSLNRIAKLTGVPFSTVRRAAEGGDHRLSTATKLQTSLRRVARDAEADLRKRAMELARKP